MKRLIISVFILILSLFICFSSYYTLKDISVQLDEILVQCLENTERADYSAVRNNVTELNLCLENNRKFLKLFIDEEITDEIANSVNSLMLFSELRSEDELITALNDCRNLLKLIIENEKLSLESVM